MNNIFMQAKKDALIAIFLVQGFTVGVFFIATLSLLAYGFMQQ